MELEIAISKFNDSERMEENFGPLNDPETDIIIKQNYPNHVLDALNIFRCILKNSEYSSRAFELSEALSNKIKNHYAVWTYRRKYLIQQKDINLYEKELAMVDKYIMEEPKGFQIWDHKRFCLNELLTLKESVLTEAMFEDEISFLQKVFDIDNKNYHAWAYRTWLIGLNKKFVSKEKEALEELIHQEMENNSYWSYYHHLTTFDTSVEAKEHVKSFAMHILALNLKNEAAWNFVNSLFDEYNSDYEEYLVSKMIQNVRFIEASYIFNQLKIADENNRNTKMLEHCFRRLIEELDTMRAKYWEWLASQSKINLNS